MSVRVRSRSTPLNGRRALGTNSVDRVLVSIEPDSVYTFVTRLSFPIIPTLRVTFQAPRMSSGCVIHSRKHRPALGLVFLLCIQVDTRHCVIGSGLSGSTAIELLEVLEFILFWLRLYGLSRDDTRFPFR